MQIRNTALKHKTSFLPSYNILREFKKSTYPAGIIIEEKKCEVHLQNLLNHTSSQIIKYLKISAESQKVLTLT